MGFSLSAATAIIGVGIFLSIQYVVSDVIPSMTETHDSLESMKNRAVEKIQSDIIISNFTYTITGSLYNLSVSVKNTGSTTLELKYFNMLVNGSIQNFTYSDYYLYPLKTAMINLSYQPSIGRLKIVSDNGVSDYLEYNI